MFNLLYFTFVSLVLIMSYEADAGNLKPQGSTLNSLDNNGKDFEKVIEIKEEISHARSFKEDDKNFMKGLLFVKGKTIRPYTVFINIHDGSFAQTTPVWTSKVKRTFQWEVPYEQALRQAMSALHHSHEQSALLISWTGRKTRQYISFVIIPKNTQMEFKIGYAAPQSGVAQTYSNLSTETEFRPGGGMQIRLKYLPKGTIILTEKFSENKETYSISHIFEQAIMDYNKMTSNPEKNLPQDIIDDDLVFINEHEYVEKTIK